MRMETQNFYLILVLCFWKGFGSNRRCCTRNPRSTDFDVWIQWSLQLRLRGGRVIYGTLPAKAKPDLRALNLDVLVF